MAVEKKEKKVYRDGLGEIKNPATSLFGKILIWILQDDKYGKDVFNFYIIENQL